MSRQPSAIGHAPRETPGTPKDQAEVREKNRRVGRLLLGLFLTLFAGAIGLAIFGH